MRSASTPASRTRTRRSRGAPAAGKGAWGLFVHTPGIGDARRRPPGLVASQLRDRWSRTRRSTSSCSPPTRRPASSTCTRSSPAARRAVPRWSLGLWVSRAYYKTPEEAADVAAKLRAHRIPCDVLTLDGRAAWKVETRFDFEWDPERFPRSDAPRSPRSRRTICASASGSIRTSRSIRRCSPTSRRAAFPADDDERRRRTCSAGTRRPRRARSATC